MPACFMASHGLRDQDDRFLLPMIRVKPFQLLDVACSLTESTSLADR